MDITKLLNPNRICVVGASEKEGFGGDTCRNIMQHMDLSRVYFVNPKRDSVFGKKCYESLSSLPEGRKDEEELKMLCRKLDIALLGPNCGGFVNYINNIYAFAFISENRDRRGSVGLISQSGQLCLSLMDSPNMKFSYAISAGNSSVVKMEDYLEYLVNDEKTRVIAMYLEGVKEPQRFAASLRKAAIKRKPVVVLKAGRSEKGGKIASSHTGSLAGSDRVYDAIFKKFGVIRVNDMEELLATSLMFSVLPEYPKRAAFASMNLSGGETGICADIGFINGINYPDFEPETIEALKQILPGYATPNNPLDMTASLSYDSELYASALRTVMKDPNIDMVVIGYTLLDEITDPAIYYMARGMEMVVSEGNAKPMVMVPFIENTRNREYSEKLEKIGVPILPPSVYAFRILHYLSEFVSFNPEDSELSLAVPERQYKKKTILSEHESKLILKNYGIPVPEERVAKTAEEALVIAENIGYPVVMKIDSPDIPHKSDIGGVKLNIKNRHEAEEAFNEIMKNASIHKPSAIIGGVLVQKMQNPGLEVIIGVNNDPQFGPCILCGLGGVFVEIFKDTVLCPAPVSKKEALNMINSLKASKLLKGYRGNPSLDIDALAEAIVNISHFACDYKDELRELDVNPVFVYENGICAVDALMIKGID